MLAIARVLRMGSRLLLLDEPSEGLAPVIVQRIGEIIREIKAAGVGVLLVEQNVKFAATVADRHLSARPGTGRGVPRQRELPGPRERAADLPGDMTRPLAQNP